MKLIKLLLILFIAAGCQKQKSDPVSELQFDAKDHGEYTIVYPEVLSNARNWHPQVLCEKDMMNLGKRMQDLCKSVFSPDDYDLAPGSILDYEDVIELQRRCSENAPYGLNPEHGEYPTENGVLDSPYLISDVIELNFISKKDSNDKKSAITIVMNSVKCSKKELLNAGVNASKRLIQYIHEMKGVEENPLILIYASVDLNSTLPGQFLGILTDELIELDEQWVYLPSSEAEKIDSDLSYEFEQLKEKVKFFLPEHVDMTAEVLFINKEAAEMNMDVHVQAKTYTEMNALALCLASSLEEISNMNLKITCQIRVMDTVLFVLERRQNQDEVHLILL